MISLSLQHYQGLSRSPGSQSLLSNLIAHLTAPKHYLSLNFMKHFKEELPSIVIKKKKGVRARAVVDNIY